MEEVIEQKEKKKQQKAKAESGTKFLRDSLIAALPPLMTKLKGVFLVPVIAKVLGAEAYGLWHQFDVVVNLLVSLLSLNLARAMYRFLAPEGDRKVLAQELVSINALVVGIALLGSVVFLLLRVPLAGAIFDDVRWAPIMVLLAVYLPVATLANKFQTFLRARRRYGVASQYAVVRDLVRLGVLTLIAVVADDVVWMLGFMVISETIGCAFLFYFVHVRMGIGVPIPRFRNLKMYLAYSVPLILTGVGYWLAHLSDRLFIVHYLDIKTVGVYSVAYSLAGLLMLVITPLQQVIAPDFAVLYERNRIDQLEKRFNTILKYFAMISMAALALSVSLAEPILVVVSTREFAGGAIVLQVVPLGIIGYGVMQLHTQLLTVLKKTVPLGILWFSVGIANVLLNFILIPALGLLGASISMVLAYLVGAVISIRIARQTFRVTFPVRLLGPLVAGAALAMAGIYLTPAVPHAGLLVNLLLDLAVGMGLYAGTLLLTGFVTNEERDLFRKTLGSRFSRGRDARA